MKSPAIMYTNQLGNEKSPYLPDFVRMVTASSTEFRYL